MIKFGNCLALLSALMLAGHPTIAFAEELVTTVEKGEPAPFDGTLFNTQAAAKLMADLKFSEEACQLEIDKAVQVKGVTMQADIDALTVRLDTCQSLCEQRLQVRDDQIEFLTKELEGAAKPNKTGWFAGGVVAGIGLTVLSGWAIGQAAGQ